MLSNEARLTDRAMRFLEFRCVLDEEERMDA